MENKIPTAEELVYTWNGCIERAMIEFAKMHVKAALKSVCDNCGNEMEKDFINDKLIKDSYPLTKIK